MLRLTITLALTCSQVVLGCAFEPAGKQEPTLQSSAPSDVLAEAHWDYSENGPAHWGEFSRLCRTGRAQSPISIIPGQTVKLKKQYDFSQHLEARPAATVVDDGHSIKVTPQFGGDIAINGENFRLLQFHFHGKSEHVVDGRRYDLVAHMVHQNLQTKQLAVVAVFFTRGKENSLLANVLAHIGGEVDVQPQNLLPTDAVHYFSYVGSLTTPPCTENVQWFLLKQPAQASQAQIMAMRSYYVDNERPTQKLNARTVGSH